MSTRVSRRALLEQAGKAGAGILLAGGVLRGQSSDITVAGQPVEITVRSVSPSTVRISVVPIAGRALAPAGNDALVGEARWRLVASRRRSESFGSIRTGNLIVRFTQNPPVIHIDTASGRTVQRLTLDSTAKRLSLLLPKGLLLGLGEGRPQFDRKGSIDTMRTGQGGYQLRTHGGRVPIQWLVGTDGWAMFIHQPIGSF